MNVYFFISIYIVIFYFIEKYLLSRKPNIFYVLLLMAPLFLISSLRGNITVDHGNYEHIFETIRFQNLSNLFATNIEPGYFLLNKVVGFFTDNFNILLTVITFIILIIYKKLFSKYYYNYALSLLILVSLGSYYVSFNVIRQYIAATIMIIAILNIDKGFSKYTLWTLFASSFHYSALLMILLYPILKINPKKLKGILIYIIIILGALLTWIFTPQIIDFVTSFVYETYASSTAYGISEGNHILTVVRPLVVFIYILFFIRKVNFESTFDRVSLNSVVLLLIFSILATRVELLNRFLYFFTPLITVYIPTLHSRVINKTDQRIYDLILIALCISYIIITQGNAEYTTFISL